MAFAWISPAGWTGRLVGPSPRRTTHGTRRIAAALLVTLAMPTGLALATAPAVAAPMAGSSAPAGAGRHPEAASVGSEVSALVRLASPPGVAGLIVAATVLAAPTFRRLARLGPEAT